MKITRVALCILTMVSITGYAAESESRTVIETYEHDKVNPSQPMTKKVAIFVANRAGADLNDQMPIFEDMITAQVTDLGFEVISREMVVSATGDLLKRSKKNDLDTLLDDRTSSLRLAQNLGADYLLFASFMGLDTEVRSVDAYNVKYDNQIFTLRGSYKILDGNTGGSLTAGMVEPSRTVQQTKHSQTTTTGLIRELLAKASKEMASSLKQKTAQIREVNVAKEQVSFQIGISLGDINFPQAEIDKDGNVKITANKATVEPLAVTVELDGFAIGTTGRDYLNGFQAAPGLHRIRLVRDDLAPYERMVNIHEGMQLNISMQLNDEGLRRWEEKTKMFNELLQKTKLNDAQVEVLRGQAQMLRQSGFKVDVKVDTDEGITIKKNQSLMNQD